MNAPLMFRYTVPHGQYNVIKRKKRKKSAGYQSVKVELMMTKDGNRPGSAEGVP